MTSDGRAVCIAFANHKGGTGKTSSCISIAGYLALAGNKVLVVDLDPQANATSGLGIDTTTLQHSMYDVFLDQCDVYDGVPITQVILQTDAPNLHVAPSEWDLSVAEVLLQQDDCRSVILNRILESVKPLYDYILLDLPPSLQLLSINGLCSADHVVIPLDPSIYSLESIHNLDATFSDICRLTGRPNPHITALLVRHIRRSFFSRLTRSLGPSQDVVARLKERFATIFLIPQAPQIYEAQRVGLPISHFAPRSRVGCAYQRVATSIAEASRIKNGAQTAMNRTWPCGPSAAV